MKLVTGCFCILMLLTGSTHAIVSDKPLLKQWLKDTEDALNKGDLDLARQTNNQALKLSQKLEDDSLVLKTRLLYNRIEMNNANYPAVLDNSLQALSLADTLGNKQALSRLHRTAGVAYGILGDNRQALEHYVSALEIYRRLNDKKGVASILNNIAVTYDNMGNTVKSNEYYLKSLELTTNIGDQEGIALALTNLGSQKRDEKHFAEARDMLNKAIGILEKNSNSSRGIYLHALLETGRIDMDQKDYKSAADIARRTQQLAKEYGLSRSLFMALELEAEVSMKTGNYSLSRKALNQAVSLAERENMELERIDIYQTQANLEEQQGNYLQALQYLNTYVELINKFEEQEDIQQAHTAQALFDSNEKKQEILRLKEEQKFQKYKLEAQQRQQHWLWGLISLAVLFIAVLMLLMQRLHLSRKLIAEKNNALVKAVEKAESLAKKDHLTQLLNRRGFLELLAYEKQRQKRHQKPISIILADIDHFKNINDLHGHQYGDRVLVSVARHLASAIRKQDSICRWGGEEFLIMLPDTNREQALTLIGRIVDGLKSSSFNSGEQASKITLTFGATTCMPDDSVDACISAADNALYKGKHQGRDTIVFSDDAAL